MMEFVGLFAAAVLLLLLLVMAVRGWRASHELETAPAGRGEAAAVEACPEELVGKIFSRSDLQFVRELRSSEIERLFERERRKVAAVWMRQTFAEIRNVMRVHSQATRHSRNLNAGVETKIFAEYFALLAVCAMLSLAIQIAGPLWLMSLGHFAQGISARVARLRESFQADALAQAAGGEAA